MDIKSVRPDVSSRGSRCIIKYAVTAGWSDERIRSGIVLVYSSYKKKNEMPLVDISPRRVKPASHHLFKRSMTSAPDRYRIGAFGSSELLYVTSWTGRMYVRDAYCSAMIRKMEDDLNDASTTRNVSFCE